MNNFILYLTDVIFYDFVTRMDDRPVFIRFLTQTFTRVCSWNELRAKYFNNERNPFRLIALFVIYMN